LALIGRIFVIIFSVMLASIAAGIAIAIGVLGPEWHGVTGDVFERTGFWLTVFVATTYTGAVSVLPLAILIITAEIFRIRSLLIYALAGAAILALGLYTGGLPTPYEESIDRPPPPIPHGIELAVAAGAVFGLIYWALAGRNAGRWREPRAPVAS